MRNILVLLSMVVLWAAGLPSRRALGEESSAGWFYTSFEASEGFAIGELAAESATPWSVLDGTAEVVRGAEGQSLLMRGAGSADYAILGLGYEAERALGAIHFACLVKPTAESVGESISNGGEFLDWDGILIGCFEKKGRGSIEVVQGKTGGDGQWIETGIALTLADNGQCADWVLIEIVRYPATGLWHLSVDGVQVFTNLSAMKGNEEGKGSLQLYSGSGGALGLDAVYIGPVPVDTVESGTKFAGHRKKVTPLAPAVVGQRKPGASRRAREVAAPASNRIPRIRSVTVGLVAGSQEYAKEFDWEKPGGDPSIIAYAPGYDDAGNRLPTEVTVRLNVDLEPGTDLSRVHWSLRVLEKWPDGFGATLGSGTFGRNLVQKAQIPGDKLVATSIGIWVE